MVVRDIPAEDTMAASNFAALEQTYTAHFVKCQGLAKLLPVEEHNIAEARKLLPTLRGILEQIRGTIPDVTLATASEANKKLATDINKFLVEAEESNKELSKEVEALSAPRPRTSSNLSGKAKVWRDNLRKKVENSVNAVSTLDTAISPALLRHEVQPRNGHGACLNLSFLGSLHSFSYVDQGDEWVEEVMSMTVWKMADSQRYSDPQYQESSSLDYSVLHSGFCRSPF